MTKEQIDKCFDPFYTTKSNGSGLGLTMCKRIMSTYGSELNIQSNPNKGTEIQFQLPLTDFTAKETQPPAIGNVSARFVTD